MGREKWNVTNTTSRNLSIGDLKFVPVIEPGKNRRFIKTPFLFRDRAVYKFSNST